MKFIVSKFGKKAVSVICALAVLLSVVSVAFGTFATDGSDSVAPYTVNVDTAPAIPVFSLTQVDLSTAVEVVFAGDTKATAGADITWALQEGGENKLTLENNVLTAYKSGTYKITATSGSKTATLWVVVANQSDDEWVLYNIDFDEVATANNYAGLTFERGASTTIKNANNSNTTYYTGAFKYTAVNGDVTTVTADNVPDNLKFPEGWHAYSWTVANAPNQNGAEVQEIPHVMAYSHTIADAASNNWYANRGNIVNSGIMPFDNPYMTNALDITGTTNQMWLFGLSGGHSRGYFVLSNEITESFSDYTIVADMDVALTNIERSRGVYRAGLVGRLRMETYGDSVRPKVDEKYTFTGITGINSDTIAGTAGGSKYIWNAKDYTNANWYGTTSTKMVSHFVYDVAIYNQGHPYAAMPSGVAMTGYGVSYNYRNGLGYPGGMDEANGVPYTRWSYLTGKGFNSSNATTVSLTNLNMGIKYEGSTATVFSPIDASQEITFSNVPTDKGAVGVYLGSIDTTSSKETSSQHVNVHSFKMSLNNNINGVAGVDYPAYTELDIYKVLQSNPAIPMYTGTYVNKADFAVQGDDGVMYLGSDLSFELYNLDSQGNVAAGDVIGIREDKDAGRIYAYQKGAYKAILKDAGGNTVTTLWIAVKDNAGEDWVLYNIDFDAIAKANNYAGLTFENDGGTKTVYSARTSSSTSSGYYQTTYKTGSFKYTDASGATTTVTNDNVPAALQFPTGWTASIRSAMYGMDSTYQVISHVMPYKHSGSATAVFTNRNVTSGIMPFDSPQTTNALGFTVDTSNYDSIFGEGGFYTNGYFLLNNDITKSFTDYKLTADMTATSWNLAEGAGSPTKYIGITGRLPVNENGVPSDEVFAGYSVTGHYSRQSGNNTYISYYPETTRTTVTQTIFGVNINKSVASVSKLDMYWHKHNRWVTSNNIAGFTVTGAGTAGSNYTTYKVGESCSYSKWSYLATNGVASGNNAGESADIVLSVLYKGNTAVVSSPDDANNQTFTYDNVYSTTGAVGVYVPQLGSDTLTSYASIHSFTIALANSDSEVPPYTKTPVLSSDNNTLELTAGTALELNEIAIVTENAIPTGDTAVWNVDSNVTVDAANGYIRSDKTGYFNGTVTANGKTIDIVIVVKDAEGNCNTIINSDNKYVYVEQNVPTDLAKYTVELGGKYSAADGVTVVPEKDSGITVADGKLTATNTGYYTVTFKTAAGDVDIVFAVTDGEYYTSDNYLFTMSDYYKGDFWKSYGTTWNDNILTSVSRVDTDAPYSRELIVPDRIYNVEVTTANYNSTLNKHETTSWSYQTAEQAGDNITNWVNIYEVGDAFSSGEYAKYVEKLSFGKYIEAIGSYAFQNYTSLKVLELPERLKTIGDSAFKNNTSLTSVQLPSTIQSIGADAFAGCTALTSVHVETPDAVTIGAGAFPAGVTVYVISGSEAEKSFKDAGYNTTAAVTEFAEKYTALNAEIKAIEAARETTVDVGTYYEINNKLAKVYKGVEIRNFSLNNRDAGVLDIPETAEWTDSNGNTATYSVTMLYTNAMCMTAERDRIYEIRLPNQAMQTHMGTFMKMANLKTVYWPDMLYNLSQYCFYDCENLTNLLVYGKESEGNMLPYNMRSIEENVFAECEKLTTLNVPQNSRLKTSTLGASFLAKSGITKFEVPIGVSKINRSAFQNATSLTEVVVYNKNAMFIDGKGNEDATSTYTDKTRVKFGVVRDSWMENYAKTNGYEYYYIDDLLGNYESNPDTNVNNYVITKGSTYNYVSDYTGIGGKLVIPSSGNTATDTMVPVYSVAKGAFSTVLDRLYAVEVSEGIVSIGESAFANATALKSVTLPNTLKTIGKEAFVGAGLTGTLTIPKNVTTISNSAFAGCTGVTAVYVLNPNAVIAADALPPNAVVYGVADSTAQSYAEKMEMKFVAIDAPSKETAADVTDNGNYKFTIDENGVITGYERADSSKAYSLKVTIPATVNGKAVTGIGSNVFESGSEASSVYAVTISEGITTISDYAFANSLKLTHVSFPKTLTTIGRSAFESCALVGDLVFTENVKDIGMMAFKGNTALTSATILNKDCLIKASAFPRGLKTFTLYGYYDSTARSFAERNKLTFVSLDGEPETGTDGGDDTTKDPDANVGEVIDPIDDEEPSDTIVTIIRESDLTTVIIVVVVMMLMMLLLGGGLILLIIIKGKKQFEENQ